MKAANNRAKKSADTERLDWLEERGHVMLFNGVHWWVCCYENFRFRRTELRDAIDAARKAEAKEHPHA